MLNRLFTSSLRSFNCSEFNVLFKTPCMLHTVGWMWMGIYCFNIIIYVALGYLKKVIIFTVFWFTKNALILYCTVYNNKYYFKRDKYLFFVWLFYTLTCTCNAMWLICKKLCNLSKCLLSVFTKQCRSLRSTKLLNTT